MRWKLLQYPRRIFAYVPKYCEDIQQFVWWEYVWKSEPQNWADECHYYAAREVNND